MAGLSLLGTLAMSTASMDYEPFDFPAAHIKKIEKYRISDQEAMGVRMPYRSTNGWNPFWR